MIYYLSRFMRGVHCGFSAHCSQLTFDFLSTQNKYLLIESSCTCCFIHSIYCLHKYKNYGLKHMLNHKPINVLLPSDVIILQRWFLFPIFNTRVCCCNIVNYSVMCDCGEYVKNSKLSERNSAVSLERDIIMETPTLSVRY